MDFIINDEELAAMSGLPHIQQLTYLRGIRPYMDVKTGLVGVKRRISHQSIAEQLYVEPHQGIRATSFSRAQVRRAIASLERTGLIDIQSEDKQLVLKCNLASLGYFVQNKAVTNPSQKADINPSEENLLDTGFSTSQASKADTLKGQKAVTPLKEDNYLYLLSQFEQFWSLYPEKKSKHKAQVAFEELNPDPTLSQKIIQGLQTQIHHVDTLKRHGQWVPPWKYPANWLAQHCWDDECSTDNLTETTHAEPTKNRRKPRPKKDAFCPPVDDEPNNVIEFKLR